MSTPTPSTADSTGSEAMPAPPQWWRAFESCRSSRRWWFIWEATRSARASEGFVKASLDLATQTTPQARRRRKSSGPPSMRCRCVRNASIFEPRPGRGGRPGVWSWLLWETSGLGTLSAARPQLVPRERFGSFRRKSRGGAVVESEHSNLSP